MTDHSKKANEYNFLIYCNQQLDFLEETIPDGHARFYFLHLLKQHQFVQPVGYRFLFLLLSAFIKNHCIFELTANIT